MRYTIMLKNNNNKEEYDGHLYSANQRQQHNKMQLYYYHW